ncbi:MAG: N-acetylneuraminate synthase family protein [Spirochaetes bacterium]|nr:N-acetylneuraminate synthase family protein [Spirochaetota bacterium]
MAKSFFIDGREFSPQNPLVIAELGTAHAGDLGKAREMIAAAAESGADCIKFQWVFADEILHKATGEVLLPGGKIPLYDRFKALEAPADFYQKLKENVEAAGLLFLCTPFGHKSARLLRELQPKAVKIASPELNYTSLLQEISRWELPVLLSAGVSRLADIEAALDILKPPLCLLHCVTAYPAPEADYNLRLLQSLSAVFGVPVGVSDHSLDPQLIPVLSVCAGAAVIEKHFCLSRSDDGLDDPIALPPKEFSQMTAAVRAAATGAEKTIEALCEKHGGEFIEKILGDGVKTLAPSEKENYLRTNRSIHALRDIEAGQVIQKSDFAVYRTEKILRPGLAPSFEDLVAGKTAKQFIPSGEGIRFEDIC